MKKPYSLNMAIERDTERLKAVEEILDTLEKNPSQTELEQMASYILYGKDENGLNAVQRGEITDENRRYSSFRRASEKTVSLEETLDNPLTLQTNMQEWDTKYVYVKRGRTIHRPTKNDPIGDSDVPFMRDLWERIDYIEHVIAINEGKIPADGTATILDNDYRLYQLKHQLIDMRRHQYYLLDYYKPTLHFNAIQFPQPQLVNWDSDSAYWITLEQWQARVNAALTHHISRNLENYETRTDETGKVWVRWVVRHQNFDWENYKHVAALINHYAAIYMQTWDKPDSWGRALIFDFDRYVDMCNFSELRLYLLTRKIDKVGYPQLVKEIEAKFGITYHETHLSIILQKEVPKAIATAAKKHRLISQATTRDLKKCRQCGRWLPRDFVFFGRNSSRYDGFASHCKECDRQRRVDKGVQKPYDRRVKAAKMLEMQTNQTNT